MEDYVARGASRSLNGPRGIEGSYPILDLTFVVELTRHKQNNKRDLREKNDDLN
jgi:hypothetical protein